MGASDRVAVVMAGGSGTRFWPLSRKDCPKQYLNLFGDRSLIQQTVDRLAPLLPRHQLYICSSEAQRPLIQRQLPDVSGLILEPCGRNTAAAVMLSVVELKRRGVSDDTVMLVLPADHFIRDSDGF